jgi:hypothetical protein
MGRIKVHGVGAGIEEFREVQNKSAPLGLRKLEAGTALAGPDVVQSGGQMSIFNRNILALFIFFS